LNWVLRLSDNLKGIVFLMLASFVFSIMALLIKLLGQHLHITQILLVRQIGMTIMVAPAILRNFPGSLRSERPGLHVIRLCCALVAMLCGFTAVIYLPLADATAIFFAKSFFVTILAVFILGETVGVYRWSAVLVGFLGVMIMLQPGTDNYSVYGLLSLAGAAGAAAVMILLRLLSRIDSPDTIMTYGALGADCSGMVVAHRSGSGFLLCTKVQHLCLQTWRGITAGIARLCTPVVGDLVRIPDIPAVSRWVDLARCDHCYWRGDFHDLPGNAS
jgi:drug/metabolite transporter (DMT)-like permease